MKRGLLAIAVAVVLAVGIPTAAFGVWDGGDNDGLAESSEPATLTLRIAGGTREVNVEVHGLDNHDFASGPFAALEVDRMNLDEPSARPSSIKLSRIIRVRTGWHAGQP